ncbi:lichenan-specific phosphotransferase enzyme IIA component [Clostridium puniceum]|uniref:Lichenan-specific phosphotransferase enzyme IIA component n=1 Tax=Clostridium puniceum TaxID=29367 RepID=A0A1S8T7Y0_9CLOT|nr:PTS lactose/cellobiose transporter subunit IIA [Clostridium puniceum]OOM73701.1 lichenan-specific phosphotransferase enzyme IIA component [Clostridium puniceum]
MNEENVQSAMQIILNAGDARVDCKQALDAIAEANISLANEKLKDAQAKITIAHKVQTDAIQGETGGKKSEYSLLFAHAQDTLMTIYSEINIAKQLVKIFESYEARISALEK